MKAARSRTMAGISSEIDVNNSHSPPFQRRVTISPPQADPSAGATTVPPVLGRWFFKTAEARARQAAAARQQVAHPALAGWQGGGAGQDEQDA